MNYRRVESPIGTLTVVGDPVGIRQILFDGDPVDPKWTEGGLQDAVDQLTEYFAGQRTEFDLRLAPKGTDFQKRVWGELRTIPYGQTTHYGALAKRLGRPTASRAVGAANGKNPIPSWSPATAWLARMEP